MLLNCLVVGAGGFLGSVGRYLLTAVFASQNSSFPWITMLINFVGSFLIGVFTELANGLLPLSGRTLLFLKTGLCGGFTTFSAFSLETVHLFEEGKYLPGIGYAAGSVLVCLFGVLAGKLCVRLLRGGFRLS